MGGGRIFNNRLLFEKNKLFFCIVFWKLLWGRQGLDGGDTVVMGIPQSPPLGKPRTEKLNFSPKGPRTVKL